jgi:hypothetical protein
MDFKKATDELFARIDHDHLAEALEISVASIRQARLRPDAKAHRAPPRDWERAVIQLAKKQALHFQRLVSALTKDHP